MFEYVHVCKFFKKINIKTLVKNVLWLLVIYILYWTVGYLHISSHSKRLTYKFVSPSEK